MYHKTFKNLRVILFFIVTALFFSAHPSLAQDTCTAQGGLSWTNTSFWSCNHIPTSIDDVIIPDGITRLVNTDLAEAATLTVNGTLQIGNNNNPSTLTVGGDVVIGSTGVLSTNDLNSSPQAHIFNIGGNLTNDGTFDGTASPSVGNVINTVLNGSSTQTISGSSTINFNSLTINSGATAAVPATNQPTVEGTLTNNGTLVQTQTVPASTATEFLHIQDAASSSDAYWGVTLTPDGSMGTTTIAIQGNQADCTSNAADELLDRCFDIEPTTDQNGTVRLYFTEAERNGLSANNLVIWHYSTSWSQVGDNVQRSEGGTTCTTGGGIACYVQADNISSYSPFNGGSTNSPTAVTLKNLNTRSPTSAIALFMIILALLLTVTGLVIRRRTT